MFKNKKSIYLTVLTVILFVVSGILYFTTNQITPFFPLLLLFFYILMLFFTKMIEGVKDDSRKLVRTVQRMSAIQMLSSLIILIGYININKPDARRFAVCFLVYYFIFTIYKMYLQKQDNENLDKNI